MYPPALTQLLNQINAAVTDYLNKASKNKPDYKSGTVERLIQEHAIYKNFFNQIKDRPCNLSDGQFHSYWKAKAFDVMEALEKLSVNEPYYDPSWADADKVLFSPVVNDSNT